MKKGLFSLFFKLFQPFAPAHGKSGRRGTVSVGSGLFRCLRTDELQNFFLCFTIRNIEPAVKDHQARHPAGADPQIGKCPVGFDPERTFFRIQFDFYRRIIHRVSLFQRQGDRTWVLTDLENLDLRKPPVSIETVIFDRCDQKDSRCDQQQDRSKYFFPHEVYPVFSDCHNYIIAQNHFFSILGKNFLG